MEFNFYKAFKIDKMWGNHIIENIYVFYEKLKGMHKTEMH